MRASSNSFATLRLDIGGQDGRAARGAALACAAQLRAEALNGGGALLFEAERWLASVEHGLCGSGHAWVEWEDLVDADAPGALAALLGSDDAGDANYPLEFGVTAHDLDIVAHPGTGGQTLVALRLCARLCALDSADNDEEAVQAALRRLLFAGRIDDANDEAAATLVADAARRRLAALVSLFSSSVIANNTGVGRSDPALGRPKPRIPSTPLKSGELQSVITPKGDVAL